MSKRKMGTVYPKRIQGILRGENPVTFFPVSTNQSGSKSDRVGEQWEDINGTLWERKNGYVAKVTKLDGARTPLFCPNCKKIMSGRYDTKMYYKWSMCMKCVIERDTKMKIRGVFKDFEERSILSSYKSFLKERKEEMIEYLDNLKPEMQYVNHDGTLEKWNVDNIEEQKEFWAEQMIEVDKVIDELDEAIEKLTKKLKDSNFDPKEYSLREELNRRN